MRPLVPASEHFPFETLRVPNHTAWRFAEKTRPFRLVWAERRCAATSHFAFFKGKMLYGTSSIRQICRALRP